MIQAIYAAEFDLIKGCIIKGSYPINLEEESYIASSMIPDGVHKVSKDKFFFKTGQLRIMPGIVKTYHYEKEWIPLFKCEFQELIQIDQDVIKIRTEKANEWLDINLQNAKLERISSNFVCITLNPHLKYGIQGEVQEQFYLAVLKNKKDSNIKRGSLIRSIAIQTTNNMFLGVVEQVLNDALEQYFNIIGVEHWENQDMQIINKMKLKEILVQTYNKLQNTQQLQYCQFSQNIINWYFREWPNYFDKQLEGLSYQASVIELLQIFKMKTRIIYRAILQQKRIMFLSHECSNSDKQYQEEIYCKTCNLVSSLLFLVMPLNINEHIQGYKSLMDPLWDKNNKWITIVSNPIFEYRKEWWDVFCDFQTQKVIESEYSNKSLFINNEQDVEFFQSLLNLINDQHITESQVRLLLFKYTTYVLKSEKLPQHKQFEDFYKIEMKEHFSDKQVQQLIKSIDLIHQDRDLDDLELLSFYLSLLNHVKTSEQFKVFFKLFIQKGCSINMFGVGLLCSDSQVRDKCKEAIKLIEKFDSQLIKKLNIMMLI